MKLFNLFENFAKIIDDFKSGTPITFRYVRNISGVRQHTTPDAHGQQLEPHGLYVLFTDSETMPDNTKHTTWKSGTYTTKNPLILSLDNWKSTLSKSYGGKVGKDLSKTIKDDGYDCIVTYDNYDIWEIVIL